MVFPLDLAPFEQYLAQRHLASQAHRPYLLRWVRRFLQGVGARADLGPADQESIFSDEIAADSKLADWQKQQAIRAIHLYLHSYLPAMGKSPAPVEKKESSPEPPAPSSAALEKMKELLRLRHYSYRNEQDEGFGISKLEFAIADWVES